MRATDTLDRDAVVARVDAPALYAHLGVLIEEASDGQYWALCPFHPETEPSLHVTEDGTFYCHGCRARGSAIDFYARMQRDNPRDGSRVEGAEFARALRGLADLVPDTASRRDAPTRPAFIPDYEWVQRKADEWYASLYSSDHPGFMAFLVQERGISPEVLHAWRVGADDETHRITIPVRDRDGRAVNVRKYRPHAQRAKCVSIAPGYGANRRLNATSGTHDPVYLMAGEMDWLRALSAGLNADSFTAGERTPPRPDAVEDWANHTVYVCYDNDAAGKEGGKAAARVVADAGGTPFVVVWPDDLPEGYDFCDLLRDHPHLDAAQWIAEHSEPAGARAYYWGDMGNAERFADQHGAALRYCPDGVGWMYWDSRRWARDVIGVHEQLATALIRAMRREADRIPDADQREAFEKFVARTESDKGLRAMVNRARVQAPFPVERAAFDTDPWLFNCWNGILDLRTGRLLPHDSGLHLSKLAGVPYRPEATCPFWDAWLDQIMCGDQELVAFVERMLGYALTGSTKEQKLFIWWGGGNNGKSTLVNVVRAIWGDYAGTIPSKALAVRAFDGHPTELMEFEGKRFTIDDEKEKTEVLAEALIKRLTGEQTVKARRMRQDFVEFPATHKIFIQTNHKPHIEGSDHGIWRRICMVPFAYRIPQKDDTVQPRLLAEAPGILARLVARCLEWQRDGLGDAEAVRAAIANYRGSMDPTVAFTTACCQEGDGLRVEKSALHQAYLTWRAANDAATLTLREFNERLEQRGVQDRRGTGGRYVWLGLALLPGAGQE